MGNSRRLTVNGLWQTRYLNNSNNVVDSITDGIMDDVENRTAHGLTTLVDTSANPDWKYFDSVDDYGGWPSVSNSNTGAPVMTDTDNDGMSDSWETAKFGVLTVSPTADNDGDGYLNIEEFLNGTAP